AGPAHARPRRQRPGRRPGAGGARRRGARLLPRPRQPPRPRDRCPLLRRRLWRHARLRPRLGRRGARLPRRDRQGRDPVLAVAGRRAHDRLVPGRHVAPRAPARGAARDRGDRGADPPVGRDRGRGRRGRRPGARAGREQERRTALSAGRVAPASATPSGAVITQTSPRTSLRRVAYEIASSRRGRVAGPPAAIAPLKSKGTGTPKWTTPSTTAKR